MMKTVWVGFCSKCSARIREVNDITLSCGVCLKARMFSKPVIVVSKPWEINSVYAAVHGTFFPVLDPDLPIPIKTGRTGSIDFRLTKQYKSASPYQYHYVNVTRVRDRKEMVKVEGWLKNHFTALDRQMTESSATEWFLISVNEFNQAVETAVREISNSLPKKQPTIVTNSNASLIRKWAKANGFDVKDRGRISQEIQNAYQAHLAIQFVQ